MLRELSEREDSDAEGSGSAPKMFYSPPSSPLSSSPLSHSSILSPASPGRLRRTKTEAGGLTYSLHSLAIVAVVDKMKDKPNKPEIQKWGLYKLLQIDTGPLKQEVVQPVISAMKLHPQNRKIQRSACEVLWKSSDADASNKAEIIRLGGGEAIICAMITHSTSEEVLMWGAGVLGNLATNDDNKLVLRNKGAIGTLVTSMRMHLGNETIQEMCCGALEALAHLAANKKEMVAQGTIAAVTSAMAKHTTNEYLQRYGCSLLQNLATSEKNVMKIIAHDGVEVVLLAMHNHPKHEAIQEFACGAIANIACVAKGAKVITKFDGERFIRRALQQFSENSWITEEARRAALMLCITDY